MSDGPGFVLPTGFSLLGPEERLHWPGDDDGAGAHREGLVLQFPVEIEVRIVTPEQPDVETVLSRWAESLDGLS